jgi:uroporphyrin-3 C-methyltransferase
MSQQPPAEQEAGAAGVEAGVRPSSSDAAPVEAAGGSRAAWVVLALVLAASAAGLAAFAWWEHREAYAALTASARETRTALDALRAHTGDVAERVAALGKALDADREHARTLTERLDPLPGRLTELERRVEADSGSSDARSEWLRAEADYYLNVANTELELGGRWETAVAALELADDRLRALADPALTRVRRLVADELLELKSVRLPDIEGVALGLGQLARRVEELPLREPGPVGRAAEVPLDQVDPGLGRLWLAVKRALAGIVRVEHSDQPVVHALSADERSLARRQLVLELELARAAALNAEPQAFAASLRNALALLDRDFDTDSAAVGGAVELLVPLLDLDIAPEHPDISESLKLLRLRPAGGKG